MPNFFFWGGGEGGKYSTSLTYGRAGPGISLKLQLFYWLIMVSRYCIVGIIEVIRSHR